MHANKSPALPWWAAPDGFRISDHTQANRPLPELEAVFQRVVVRRSKQGVHAPEARAFGRDKVRYLGEQVISEINDPHPLDNFTLTLGYRSRP